MNNLVIFNANDGQLPQVDLFLKTLKDPRLGDFNGDICLITTIVSKEVEDYLVSKDVIVFQYPLGKELWRELPFARLLAAYEQKKTNYNTTIEKFYRRLCRIPYSGILLQRKIIKSFIDNVSQKQLLKDALNIVKKSLKDKNIEMNLYDEFDLYMRKHFSKLNLFKYLEHVDKKYDNILLTDADMIFQKPVSEIFDKVEDGKIYIENEMEPLTPNGGSPVYGSNLRAIHLPIYKYIQYGKDAFEVNVGIVLGKANAMHDYLQKWKSLMFDSGYEELFYCHKVDFWHEQDYFRLLRDMNKDVFVNIGKEYFYHAVHSASKHIVEIEPLVFKMKDNNIKPYIVHFAGGYWKYFRSVRMNYEKSINEILN